MIPSKLHTAILTLLLFSGCEIPNDGMQGNDRQRAESESVIKGSGKADPVNVREDKFLHAKCVGVIDGDTVDILTPDKEQVRLRLASIDAPERGQPFGNTAKKFLSDLIFGKEIEYTVTSTDKYGRSIAFISLDSEDVNAAMIQEGLAWHYLEYSDDENLTRLESVARADKRGLWSDGRHVAPWDWRKLSKEERDKLR